MKPYITILLLIVFQSCKNQKQSEFVDRIYFENGQLRREVLLVNGLKEGIMTDYYNDGKLHSQRNFVKNIQCGKSIFYHDDGKTLKEVQYYDSNGKKILGDTIWYKNGAIEFYAAFKNDQKNGLLARFDSLGQVMYKATFLNDTLLKVEEGAIRNL